MGGQTKRGKEKARQNEKEDERGGGERGGGGCVTESNR